MGEGKVFRYRAWGKRRIGDTGIVLKSWFDVEREPTFGGSGKSHVENGKGILAAR